MCASFPIIHTLCSYTYMPGYTHSPTWNHSNLQRKWREMLVRGTTWAYQALDNSIGLLVTWVCLCARHRRTYLWWKLIRNGRKTSGINCILWFSSVFVWSAFDWMIFNFILIFASLDRNAKMQGKTYLKIYCLKYPISSIVLSGFCMTLSNFLSPVWTICIDFVTKVSLSNSRECLLNYYYFYLSFIFSPFYSVLCPICQAYGKSYEENPMNLPRRKV